MNICVLVVKPPSLWPSSNNCISLKTHNLQNNSSTEHPEIVQICLVCLGSTVIPILIGRLIDTWKILLSPIFVHPKKCTVSAAESHACLKLFPDATLTFWHLKPNPPHNVDVLVELTCLVLCCKWGICSDSGFEAPISRRVLLLYPSSDRSLLCTYLRSLWKRICCGRKAEEATPKRNKTDCLIYSRFLPRNSAPPY